MFKVLSITRCCGVADSDLLAFDLGAGSRVLGGGFAKTFSHRFA
jgi:hypothetical protein